MEFRDNEFNPFGRSLKNFRKLFRAPPDESNLTESVNVYKHSKALSMNLSYSTTSITATPLNRSQDPVKLNTKPLIPLCSKKSIKIKKSAQPYNFSEKLQKLSQNSIFTKKKLNIQNLTQLSQKESIIFNQVKKFEIKSKNEIESSTKSSSFNLYNKTKTNPFKKLGTMKQVLLSQDSDNCDLNNEEQKTLVGNNNKRKQLKGHVWRWVGSSGDQVY